MMKKKRGMLHYLGCGLPNVWLRNGYEERGTAYGKAVSVQDVEGLHRAIGLMLVRDKPLLSRAEVRFLRKELDLSQGALGQMLGVGETTVRGWESPRGRIPRPAERLLRQIYLESQQEDSLLRELIERIAQIDREAHTARLEFERDSSGHGDDGEWRSAA